MQAVTEEQPREDIFEDATGLEPAGTIPIPRVRLCGHCGIELPPTRKSHRCKSCHAAYCRHLRARHRKRTIKSFVAEVARLPPDQDWRIRALVSELSRRFNGISNLAEAMMEQFEISRQTAPGGPAVVRFCAALMRLLTIAEESEADLEEAQWKEQIETLIEQRAREIAGECGADEQQDAEPDQVALVPS